VSVLRDGEGAGRLAAFAGPRLGGGPLWGEQSGVPLGAVSVPLVLVWTPVGCFIPGQSFSYPDSWGNKRIKGGH